jgi:putative RNA 2'-phosphotransferase
MTLHLRWGTCKMTDKHQIKTSKFLSLVLRHKPATICLTLDENGWADTKELLAKINDNDFNLTFDELKTVVENSDKKRFLFSADFSKIRANQGHSIKVDLELTEKVPPEILFHGTADKNLKSIKEKGLIKGQRHHVHLSANNETAYKVGQRYGKPIILTIKSSLMHDQGIKFYQSENGVWLTDIVLPNFIEFPS